MQSAEWNLVTHTRKKKSGASAGAGYIFPAQLRSDSAKLRRVTMLLPASIWSLVSLLVLDSEDQSQTDLPKRIEEFLEAPAGAPELAAETLQVCTFLIASIIHSLPPL